MSDKLTAEEREMLAKSEDAVQAAAQTPDNPQDVKGVQMPGDADEPMDKSKSIRKSARKKTDSDSSDSSDEKKNDERTTPAQYELDGSEDVPAQMRDA